MPKHLTPEAANWLAETFARNRARFAGMRMEAEVVEPPAGGDKPKGDAFTQADVDRIVAERLKREREATKTKYADYDDLKQKAEGAKTAEERIAALEKDIEDSKRDALRAKYAADVPEKLRPLLTGTTDDELKAQRDLLIEGESERKKRGNTVPTEGKTTPKPGEEKLQEFTRNLFGRDD